MTRFSHSRTVAESLREYGLGIAGGLMFSIPLFYTQEMWNSGFIMEPWRILIFMAATFGILLLYNRFVGLRSDATLREVAIDSVEEMGLGLLLSAALLTLLGIIGMESAPMEAIGGIVLQGMTAAVGVSIGTAQLGTPDNGESGTDADDDDPESFFPQMALALCGAVLFAANIAPTDEVVNIASGSTPPRILLIMAASLAICTLMFTFSDSHGAEKDRAKATWLPSLRAILGSYTVALIASAVILALYRRFDGEPLSHCLNLTVVLGFPTALGASAGRLLLQTGDD